MVAQKVVELQRDAADQRAADAADAAASGSGGKPNAASAGRVQVSLLVLDRSADLAAALQHGPCPADIVRAGSSPSAGTVVDTGLAAAREGGAAVSVLPATLTAIKAATAAAWQREPHGQHRLRDEAARPGAPGWLHMHDVHVMEGEGVAPPGLPPVRASWAFADSAGAAGAAAAGSPASDLATRVSRALSKDLRQARSSDREDAARLVGQLWNAPTAQAAVSAATAQLARVAEACAAPEAAAQLAEAQSA